MKNNMISLSPYKRVLYLTKDLGLIKEQLYNGLTITMNDIKPKDLLDDINTDIMTPAWVCFHHDPMEIAKRAYAGLFYEGDRVFKENALLKGNFEAIVSGERKGTGSSRETASQCEKYSGINLIFAASFAPIHQRNNINLGQIMGNYSLLKRLEAGESIPIEEFLSPLCDTSKKIVRAGGLFNYLNTLNLNNTEKKELPTALNIAQKIMKKKIIDGSINNGESFIARVDGGYSHEFTSAQVHQFLIKEYGKGYSIKNSDNFAAFEDHLIYADSVKKYAPFLPLIKELRDIQKIFIRQNEIKDYSAKNGVSPGICHEVARTDMILPGDFIQATDSHTCMGGALNAYAHGIGATEYAALLATGLVVAKVPKTIRFDLHGKLKPNATAKDLMLYILSNYTKKGLTLNKVMEFGGEGLFSLNIDERATLCNMATECGAKTGICEPDNKLVEWLCKHRPHLSGEAIKKLLINPDKGCKYQGGKYNINLNDIEPMVAHPGEPDKGIPSDPTNGEYVKNLENISIDIAYGGSCTAGKNEDIEMYARVCSWALRKGLSIPNHVKFFVQYGSLAVQNYSKEKGYDRLLKEAGIKIISPGCGACIGCGPGVSNAKKQVSISAINRNFQGRSGPGQLYLASPLTVAASAFYGKITAFHP